MPGFSPREIQVESAYALMLVRSANPQNLNTMTNITCSIRRCRSDRVFKLTLSVLAALSLNLTSSGQSADRPPVSNEDEQPIELPEFTVSTEKGDQYRAEDSISAVRIRSALIDTASSISVMTRAMMDDLGPTRIFDATRYVAGVQEGRGIQFSDRQIIRGFENNGRTVDNFLQGGQGGSAADNLDESVIDRIEVAKGPNAILSPAGAPGGSINVITKSPNFNTSQRSVTTVLGLYDAQKISVDATGPFSKGSPLAYRLIASVQDSRRYWSNDARLRGKVFAPMISYKLSDKTQITFKLIAAEHWVYREPAYILDPAVTASTSDPYLAPGFSTKSRNGIQPWSHVGTHTADAFVLLTSTLSQHLTMRFAANGRYYHEDSMQEFFSTPGLTNRYNPYTGELTQDSTWALDTATNTYVATASPYFNPTAIPVRGDKQSATHKTGTVQNDFAMKYQFGSVSSQTVVGWAAARQTSATEGWNGTLPALDLTNTGLRADPVWGTSLAYNPLSNFTNWQLYVSEKMGFWKEMIQLSAGALRYGTRTESSNGLTPAAAPSVLSGSKDMYLGSILVKPMKQLSAYYSYSTNATPTIANNTAMWRDGKQHEVGVKSEFFNKRLSFNVAYFKIAQTNVTVPNPERQVDITAPEQLISDQKNNGMEFEVMGGITKNFSVVATYTHLKMRDSLGRPVRAVADKNAALLLNYRFDDNSTFKGLAVNLGVTYNGRRPGDTTSGNFTELGVIKKQSFYIAPYYVTTLGVNYKRDHMAYRLSVDNLLNDNGYLQQAGGRVSGTGLSTATGINVKLSTTYQF